MHSTPSTAALLRATDFINAYLGSSGPFASRRMLVGMAASEGRGLFCREFSKLAEVDREAVAEILVKVALCEPGAPADDTALSLHLMLGLCYSGYVSYFLPFSDRLVKEFQQTQNLKWWAECGDPGVLPEGSEFKKDWHYGLMLFRVITCIGSAIAVRESAHILEGTAKSQIFRESLRWIPSHTGTGLFEEPRGSES